MLIASTPELMTFSMVYMRLAGFVFFNPVFSRRNIPSMYKAGLVFVLTLVVYPNATVEEEISLSIVYGILLMKELLLGYLFGFTMQVFDMIATYAGSVMDYQMGLAMATIYDPQNGTQIALTGNILQIYFLLLFFAVDGHLAVIRIICESGNLVPYGQFALGTQVIESVLSIFTAGVELVIKLSFPIIGFELLMEMAIGLLMKMIPQINLFIISIQLRVIMGIIILMTLISPIGTFLNNQVNQMIQTLQQLLLTIAG
jgi:flagellar biosynthetic protein FliR